MGQAATLPEERLPSGWESGHAEPHFLLLLLQLLLARWPRALPTSQHPSPSLDRRRTNKNRLGVKERDQGVETLLLALGDRTWYLNVETLDVSVIIHQRYAFDAP